MKTAHGTVESSDQTVNHFSGLAKQCLLRCDELACHTEIPGQLTRRFLTPPMHAVHDQIRSWTQPLGMQVRIDHAGNFVGRRPASIESDRTLLIGSHLDTIPNAGKYDGPLGVLIGLAVLESLADVSLPFHVDLIGFSEEEGVRFGLPYLGSRAIAGSFDEACLNAVDDQNVSLKSAIESFGLDPRRINEAAYHPDEVIAFVEAHIEQGPILSRENQSVAVVEAIVGQSRLSVRFLGQAGHAGTMPMVPRRDALVAASRWIVAVSDYGRSINGLRCTVGQANVTPNVRNAIAGVVELSLDVRHSDDRVRNDATRDLMAMARQSAAIDDVDFEVLQEQTQKAIPMSTATTKLLAASMTDCAIAPFTMTSGAGHDSVVMAESFSSAMLFLRQPSGISHHPDEDVREDDVASAIEVIAQFVRRLALQHLPKAST